MKFLIGSTLAVLCFVSISYADNSSLEHFRYNVRIPGTANSCLQEAQSLATKIAQAQRDAKNIVGTCLATTSFTDNGETFTLYSLLVEYDAAASQINNTKLAVDAAAVDPDSTIIYPTYRACLNDLPNQVSLFTKSMGLAPIATYCDEGNISGFGFTLTFDSIGKLNAGIYSFIDRAVDYAKGDSSWHNNIVSIFNAAAANPNVPGGANVAIIGKSFILYYASLNVGVSSQSIVQTYSMDECTAQENVAKMMLKNDGANHTYVACHSIDYGRFSLDVIADTYDDLAGDAGAGSPMYYSFAECLANRQIMSEKAVDNGLSPLGVFCGTGLQMNRYQIEIYSR